MIRNDVYKAMLSVLSEEIPGVRAEVQRKIAQRVGSKVAAKLDDIEMENARLNIVVKALNKKLNHLGTRQFRGDLQRTITFLNTLEGKTDGEEPE